MQKITQYQLLKNAAAYALARPRTDVYKKLTSPFVFPKNRVGTHMEYIWRIILKGLDVLDREDNLVKNPRFTRREIIQAQKSIQALERAITAPHTVTRKGLACIQGLPDLLIKIITYHLDKARACNTEGSRLEARTWQVKTDFINACHTGNYGALAKLYPYLGDLLEIDENDAIPTVLRGKMQLPPEWCEHERMAALEKMFHNAPFLNPYAVAAYLGPPDDGLPPNAATGLRLECERHFEIFQDASRMIEGLAHAVGKPCPVQIDPLHDLYPQHVPA